MKDATPIDELFREGLAPNEVPFPFREEDWEKLEGRLDRYAKRRRIIFWLRPASGIAAILLLALAIWSVWPEKPKLSKEEVITEQKEPLKVVPPEQVPSVADDLSSPGGPAEEPSQGVALAEKTIPPGSDLEQAATSGPGISMDHATERLTPRLIRPREASLAGPAIPEQLLATKKEEAEISKTQVTASATPQRLPSVPDEKKKPQLAVSLLLAPAYNGVNNLNDARIGADAGLLLSLGISKRLRVSTGALYGIKLYETGYQNYNPPQTGGYNSYHPQQVDADCRVLDIPLNIDYAILDRRNVRFSLGTGVSSYLMLKENYNFVSAYQNGSGDDDIEIVNGSQHWLSVLNLQANYERQLSTKFSISLRPYLKIPFRDIGYGRVRLQSFGMALSTSWNF